MVAGPHQPGERGADESADRLPDEQDGDSWRCEPRPAGDAGMGRIWLVGAEPGCRLHVHEELRGADNTQSGDATFRLRSAIVAGRMNRPCCTKLRKTGRSRGHWAADLVDIDRPTSGRPTRLLKVLDLLFNRHVGLNS